MLPLGRVTVTATTGDRAAVCGPAAAAARAAGANNILFRRNQAYLSVYPVYYLSTLPFIKLYVCLSRLVFKDTHLPPLQWLWCARARDDGGGEEGGGGPVQLPAAAPGRAQAAVRGGFLVCHNFVDITMITPVLQNMYFELIN